MGILEILLKYIGFLSAVYILYSFKTVSKLQQSSTVNFIISLLFIGLNWFKLAKIEAMLASSKSKHENESNYFSDNDFTLCCQFKAITKLPASSEAIIPCILAATTFTEFNNKKVHAEFWDKSLIYDY
jgi:hypothetical protein